MQLQSQVLRIWINVLAEFMKADYQLLIQINVTDTKIFEFLGSEADTSLSGNNHGFYIWLRQFIIYPVICLSLHLSVYLTISRTGTI